MVHCVVRAYTSAALGLRKLTELRARYGVLRGRRPATQCAGFCAETGAVSGRDRPAQACTFNDLAVWHGGQKRPISIRTARVVGSSPISGIISFNDLALVS